jgi:hypothetical protein
VHAGVRIVCRDTLSFFTLAMAVKGLFRLPNHRPELARAPRTELRPSDVYRITTFGFSNSSSSRDNASSLRRN